MLDLDYYDRLKNAAVVPDKLKEFFEDESQSYFCYETLLPSIRVLLYAASNEKYLFSVLYEKITKAENLPPFFYERLKPDDLFNCLGLLGDDCLFSLLSKLDCSDSTLIQLHQTVIERDLVGFRAVLEQGNINTATITPICKLLYIRIRIDTGIEWLIENSQYIDEITDEEQIQSELKKLVRCLNSSAQSFLNEVFNNEKEVMSALTSSTDKMTSVINNAMTSDGFEADCSLEIDDFLIEGVVMGLKALGQDVQKEDFSKQEWLENIFRMVLWCYYTMKKESIVSLTALDVLREVVFIPRYEGVWEKYENSNGLELLDKDLDIFWGDGIVKDTQPTPQIEEPAAEDVKDALKRPQNSLGQGRGRPQSSWIKGRSQIKEEDVGALIQKNIWESLIKSVEKLKFKKGIEGITKEKQVKNFSAGLLYYALEEIGWARVFDEFGIQSSFVRTMKFAGIAKTSFEKNIRYIHEWYNLADEYKGHPNQFDDCYSTCKEKDPNMAFLVFENVNETGKTIDNLKVKLKKTLDESCKL